MENKLRDRVRQYCEYMNIRVSQFEKRAGLSNGYFNQVSKKPSDAKLAAIANAHPNLNLDWFITGHGDMIKDIPCPKELIQSEVPTEEKPSANDSLIEYLQRKIEDLEREKADLLQENAILKYENKLLAPNKRESVRSVDSSLSADAI